MTRSDALELLRSGTALTEDQKTEIAKVLAKTEHAEDADWNGSDDDWETSDWQNSDC